VIQTFEKNVLKSESITTDLERHKGYWIGKRLGKSGKGKIKKKISKSSSL